MARPQTTRIGFLSLGLLELVESCILPKRDSYFSNQTRETISLRYVCGFTDLTSKSNSLPQVS